MVCSSHRSLITEIYRGILEESAGEKRAALETWFGGKEGPQSLFADRILPFDGTAALVGRDDGTKKGNGPPA